MKNRIRSKAASRDESTITVREDVMVLRRMVLGPEHPKTIWTMSRLAMLYDEAGLHDEAIKLREEVLALRRKLSNRERDGLVKRF